jgi:cation diffusion facilitator CzcD-associated flavoprotein CzcO
MFTLGYSFKPWTDAKAIADGPAILHYIRETAREHDLEGKIRFGHRVTRASWSTPRACWELEVERSGGRDPVTLTCNFLYSCAGYYRYDHGHTPDFPGRDRFAGRVVHPQHWTPDIEHAGKRVVVIGSGATAVTLVPALAKTAAHVVMLQRSPTYVVSRPAHDAIADGLRNHLPSKLAYGLSRWKNVLVGMAFFQVSRRRPALTKKRIVDMVRAAVGPDVDVDRHFSPGYNPWDQRVCLVPDGDLFDALRQGRASVVTDTIQTFTPQGIRLQSGQELAADLVVTATGLQLNVLGDVRLSLDGVPVDAAQLLVYKGMMYGGLPNLANTFGYTNASWTLKADLIAEHVCRILNHMDRAGLVECRPINDDPDMAPAPWFDFSSGYIQRAMDKFPKLGPASPWRAHQNYFKDLMMFRTGPVDDGVLRFRAPEQERRSLAA